MRRSQRKWINRSRSRWVCCHIVDANNIGDKVCCPKDYFPWLSNLPVIDIREPNKSFRGKSVIFGGGGMLFEHLAERMYAIHKYIGEHGGKTITWGIGSNRHGTVQPTHPIWLRYALLSGIRDRGNPYTYVPCSSCLHPAFSNYLEATRELVVYEHFDSPIPVASYAPRMHNFGQKSKFEDVIKFLMSGKRILTNTYHGAYWGRLLGRSVTIYEPFSTRFFGFDPPAIMCNSENWETMIHKARPADDYLVKCRRLNMEFAERVRQLISA